MVENLEERQKAEEEFYETFYKNGWEKQTHLIDETIVPPNMYVYWHFVKEHINQLKSHQSEVRVLDCGCGHGVLSVLLAGMGGKVTAGDLSSKSIEIVQQLAKVNGVEKNIHARICHLENLLFEDDSFDCVLGTRVLHHVDIGFSAPHLARVLKSQGLGIFWECTEKNAVLRFIRGHIRRLIPLPKFGTKYEHPLTKEEIGTLETAFGQKARILDAPFYFFSFLDQYIIRQRVRVLSHTVKGIDSVLAKYVPILNRYSFHQILVLQKQKAVGYRKSEKGDPDD
ncbi:MAG: class I SAM-dependent methyltransferase [Thermodesulfovibrionales bacterium]|nr:class I SAM-dependent methyltransferase [Thermodesulfovibrionales bacterium]